MVLAAAAVSLALMACFELAKELFAEQLWPLMTRWESHVLTILFAGAITGIAARLVLGHQRRLTAQVLEESTERARLLEVRHRLQQRTDELEAAATSLAQEIADRRRIEGELRQSEAINRAVLNALPDLAFRLGSDGFFRSVHIPQGFPVEGSERDWVGHHISERLPPDVSVPALERMRACLVTGEPQGLEFHVTRGDRALFFEARFVSRDGAEVLGLVRDITDQVRLERDLAHAQKMESVGRLAGGMAHDFNNLLTSISAHAEFVADALPETSEARDDLAGIRHSTALGAQLTRKLLSFARRQPVAAQRVDLNALVQDLDVVLRRTVGGAIVVETHVAEDAAITVADPGQLEQVVLNLSVNARDAMPAGGRLTVHVVAEPEWVVLRVSDTGVGMSAETQERIFEPFFTTKPEGQGTGLGLSMVYGIVTRAGGVIDVSSRLGAGTTFVVRLPRAQLPGPHETAEREEPSLRGTETVLVCEDDPAVRQLAVRALRRFGYQVLTAIDGAHALDVARAHPDPIDLLLTDVLMPRMGGPELAQRLKRERPALAVVFMSGYTAGHDLGESTHDTVRLVAKPFDVRQLVGAVRRTLDLTVPRAA
jgi:signal transduction histidine kinase/ActR/RegA family two-component response regulator